MDFQEEKYAKGAADYDRRIRSTWPFYEAIHPAMNAMLRSLLPADSELLIVGAGTGAEIIELGRSNPGWRFLGLDPAQPMLDLAKDKIEAAGVSKPPFSEDMSMSCRSAHPMTGQPWGWFYFVADDGGKLKLLRSIASHLKPGAPLVLMDAYGDLTTSESQLLLEAWKHQQNLAGLTREQVEDGMKERIQAIHFVSSDRIAELLTEAGFHRIQRFFQNVMLGGWIAFKG